MRHLSISYGDQSAQLKEIRDADPDGQGRHSFTAQQPTLRRLKVVFAASLKHVRAVKGHKRRVGYPRFKPYQRFDQVLFVAGDGVKWEPVDGGRWAHATFRAVGRVKSILDAGWTQFARILVAKAESAGRPVIFVPSSTSIDCHTCGARCVRPRQDTVVCPVHGELDADLNGARNIASRAGLGSGQASAA
jgi:Putative transposase DNA-binding domain